MGKRVSCLFLYVMGLIVGSAHGMSISSEVDLFNMLTNKTLRTQTHSLSADITCTGFISKNQIKDLREDQRYYSFDDFTGVIEGNRHTLTFATTTSLSGGTFRYVNFASDDQSSAINWAIGVQFENCTVGSPLTQYIVFSAELCRFENCTATKGAGLCCSSGNDYDDGSGSTFENCTSRSAPIAVEAYNKSKFVNCHVTGPIVQESQFASVGGVVCSAKDCEFDSCSWDGEDSNSVQGDFHIGGIVGKAENTRIFNCKCLRAKITAIGGDCGGIVGWAKNCDISACQCDGKVTGGGAEVGGLVGSLDGGELTDSTATADVSSTGTDAGGAIGAAQNAQVENIVAKGAVAGGKNDVGGFVGLAKASTFRRCAASGNVTVESSVTGKSIHSYGGFAGECMSGSKFTACSASGKVTVASGLYVAGFIGESDGGTFDECCATGAASGGERIAGFAGTLGNTAVSSFANCFATGAATATKEDGAAAAFIGWLGDARTVNYSVRNCYATGCVTATSSNPTMLSPNEGGLSPIIRYPQFPSLPVIGVTGVATASFWGSSTTGMSVSGLMGEGKTLGEMKCQCTYSDVGWDFGTIWEMTQLYPRLRHCDATGKSSNVLTRKITFYFTLSVDLLNTSRSDAGPYCQWSVDGKTWHQNGESVALETGEYTVKFKPQTPLFEDPDDERLLISASDAASRDIYVSNPTRNSLKVHAITDSPGCGFDESRAYWYVEASSDTAEVSMMSGDATHQAMETEVPIAGGWHKLSAGYDAPAGCEWIWRPVFENESDIVYVSPRKNGNVFDIRGNTWTVKFRAYTKEEIGDEPENPSRGGEEDPSIAPTAVAPVSAYAAAKAQTLKGSVYNGSELVGVIDLKVGKVSKRTGLATVSGTITARGGEKIRLVSTKTKISADSVSTFSVPVKGHGTMTITLGAEGFSAESTENWRVGTAQVGSVESGRMVFKMGRYPIWIGDQNWKVLENYLPMAQEFTSANGKWKFPKAAAITMKKGVIVIKKGGEGNLSAMKITNYPKKGTFKGSFKIYTTNGVKLRKYSATVTGVVADGIYSAWVTIKKVRGTFTGEIRAVD